MERLCSLRSLPLTSHSFILPSLLLNSPIALSAMLHLVSGISFRLIFVLPPFTFPHLPYLPATTHLSLTLAAFYLNLKPISSINRFLLRPYLFLGLSLRISTLNFLSSPLLTILSFIFNRYIFSSHECGRLRWYPAFERT